MRKLFTQYLLLLFAASSILVSCSKDDITPDSEKTENKVSTDNSLRNFSFQQKSNASLAANCYATSGFDVIYITVPDGTPLNSLVPSFTADSKAAVKCGGETLESDSKALDFTETVTITVTSESGIAKQYTIIAKNGESNIDSKVYKFMLNHDIPGVSVSISKDEEIVYSSGYGLANTETMERVTVDHMFRLASMSKQHTAIAIMTLMERGLLSLEDIVFGEGGILEKDFGNNMSSDWKSIKVKHLLSHTGGLDPGDSYRDCMFGSSIYDNKTTKERVALLLKRSKIKNTPGAVFHYNNSYFGILGLVVERLSGKTFTNFMKEDIYAPIGISHIDGGENDRVKKGEVYYYGQDGKNPFGNDVEAGVAAGGVIASAPDLMKLMAHIDYGTKVPDILSKETLDRMYKAINVVDKDGASFNQYALGWRINYSNYPDWAVLHGGTLAGVCPIWARSYDNVNGVVLCNSRSYNKNIDSEMWHMLEDLQDMYR